MTLLTKSRVISKYLCMFVYTPTLGFTQVKKNPNNSILAPTLHTTSVLFKWFILAASQCGLLAATASCNEFKAPLRPEAADGKQLLPVVFCGAQTKPLCVRNNSNSWAEQSETSIRELVLLHPSEHSSGSQQEQQRMPKLGTALQKYPS